MKKFKTDKNIRKYVEAATNRFTGDVELWYRDEKGRKFKERIEGYCYTDWYFYITKDDYDKLEKEKGLIKSLENNEIDKLKLTSAPFFEIEDNGKWVKVFISNGNINEKYSKGKDDRLRFKKFLENRGIRIYEGDLQPHKRYCIDNDIRVSNNFKVLFFDIETDDRGHGILVGRDTILSIAGYDQDGKSYFWYKKHSQSDDEDFLIKFMEDIRFKFDVLVGWNSDVFDKPYIIKRFQEHEINIWGFKKNIAHIDLMQIFIKRFSNNPELTSWKLDFIAYYFLGEKKIEVEKGNGKIYELYLKDFEKFKKYNLRDSWLLYELDNKLGVIQQILLECQITGCFPSKFSVSELLDTYILRSIRDKDLHFPSIEYGDLSARCSQCNHSHIFEGDELPFEYFCKFCNTKFNPENKHDDIAGAYVIEPATGRYDNVFVFDFKSLYPTIIDTWNIGPDSFIEKEDYIELENEDIIDNECMKSANDQFYWKNKPSIFKIAIKELLSLRRKFKNKMLIYKPGTREYEILNAKQRATKLLSNSMYGILAYPRGRFYRKEIAESITLGGQWLIKTTKKWFEEKGYRVLYGDTDSIFTKIPLEDKEKISKLLKELKSFYNESLKKNFNIDKHTIDLEYEKHFRRFILVQKKRYSGHIIEQDGVTIDKILIKGLEYVKRDTIPLGRKWQKELLDSLINEDYNKVYYIKWVEDKMKFFFEGDYDISDIIITKKLSKNPKSYKVRAIHVEIAEELKKRELEYYIGMRVPYIVTSDKPLEASHPMWYEKGTASVKYYWDKQIFAICQRILEAVFKEYDWSQYSSKIKNKRQKKIEQYERWLKDSKKMKTFKSKEKTIAKIKECKVISDEQRDELLKPFNLKKFQIIESGGLSKKPKIKILKLKIKNK